MRKPQTCSHPGRSPALGRMTLAGSSLLLLLAALSLSACNTVEGMGEDLQSASQSVEEEIQDE